MEGGELHRRSDKRQRDTKYKNEHTRWNRKSHAHQDSDKDVQAGHKVGDETVEMNCCSRTKKSEHKSPKAQGVYETKEPFRRPVRPQGRTQWPRSVMETKLNWKLCLHSTPPGWRGRTRWSRTWWWSADLWVRWSRNRQHRNFWRRWSWLGPSRAHSLVGAQLPLLLTEVDALTWSQLQVAEELCICPRA